MKRKFQLTGAILSIILGAVEVFAGLIVLIAASVASDLGSNSLMGLLLIATLASFAFGIAVIILGANFCKNKKSTGIAIALLVLISVLILLSLSNVDTVLGIFMLIVRLATLGMLITYLVVKDAEPATAVAENTEIAQPVQPAKPSNKIELLTSLRDNGTITEEEFKDLLKKELEK